MFVVMLFFVICDFFVKMNQNYVRRNAVQERRTIWGKRTDRPWKTRFFSQVVGLTAQHGCVGTQDRRWIHYHGPIYPLSPIRGCFGIILIFFNTAYRDEGIDQLRTKTTTINQTYPKTNTTTLFLTYRDHFLCQLGSRRMMYWSRSGIVKYAFFSRKNHRFFRDVLKIF